VADIGLLAQEEATTTAVSIVTVDTLSCHDWRVLPQLHRFFMAGETDLVSWHFQVHSGHVAVGLHQMAYRARNRHGGVD
jgi:hypothetical protein